MTIKLYQYPPALGLPNASPFCMKLETWLRMAGIAYEPKYGMYQLRAPKGKLPYIEDGGRILADSSLIIDYLKAAYGDKLDAGISPEQAALALAIQRLLEDHLYWALLHCRWLDEPGWSLTRAGFFDPLPAPACWIAPVLAKRELKRQLRAQGLGRHTGDEIYRFGMQDLDALSALLGTRQYFLRDEPSSIDACAYAFLANILLVALDSPLKQHAGTLPNLVAYCERMRARYYPSK